MTSRRSRSSTHNPGKLKTTLGSVLRKFSPSRGKLSSINNGHHEPSDLVDEQDSKGALGLNLLYSPTHPTIDFIFVHGLGGGSRKTWASSTDPQQYWPEAWLPHDTEFSSVRIHSFGYNSNLREWRSNTLNILDFARSLLGEISCNAGIRRSSTKIVLIGHSMGGIVIKKAYMLAREDNALKNFASRVHTLYFLATPHRGTDYTKFLANILTISSGEKSFVSELDRESTTIASINDSFRHYCGELKLWSFYETNPTRIFGFQAVIVDVTSATLGLPNESCRPLNADHRGVCKFKFKTDPNYRTLRSCFIASIDDISLEDSMASSRAKSLDLERLGQLLGISEASDEELLAREEIRTPNTCDWLTKRQSYTSWQIDKNTDRPLFWLAGNAGAGKSILCSRIAILLQRSNQNSSHFFFKNGDSQRSSLAMCLRSLANQMARSDDSILRKLLEVQPNSSGWESWDDKKLWQKLFVAQIFSGTHQDVHYWVIDSVDECQKSKCFLNLLVNTPPWLKVLFTSRSSFHNEQHVSALTQRLEYYQMQSADTLADFRLFIDSKLAHVPASCETNRENLKQRILDKSSGSFLWVSLVMDILAKSYSEEAAEEVLEEVPTDMNSLYDEMLGSVLQNHRGVVLAKSLYTWTLLASRPLKIDGLQAILKLDTNQTVHNLSNLIPAISGQLVTVNQNQEAEVIHQTAKVYLLQQVKHPDLVLDKLQCHTQMAQICLKVLAGVSADGPLPRRPSRHLNQFLLSTSTDFVDYACEHFSDHLRRSFTENDKNWELLCMFLDCNVLFWIEFLAKKRHMESVTRTAQNLGSYFRRRVKYLSPISPQKADMESWIYDLFRLSAKFGNSLNTSPSSIYHLVPSMCPSESKFSRYRKNNSSNITFSIKGILESSWDDCLACIDFPNYQTSAITCGDQYSAVALTNGTIHVYFQESGQPKLTLNHYSRPNILLFSAGDRYLATSGQRKVKIWDPVAGLLLWDFETKHQVLNLSFTDNDQTLTGASQGNYLLSWDLKSGEELDPWQWTESVRGKGEERGSWPQPWKAVFSADHEFLAVNYRGLPLHLFNSSSQTFVGVFNRESETGLTGAVNVEAFTFNPSTEINILIVSYADGELVVYDIDSKQLRYRRPDVFAHCLKCSPNGRTLITGSSNGAIRIFEFAGAGGERLLPQYTMNAQDDGIRDIAISSDSNRFADIRGSQYRIWEPAILSCNDINEGSQSELSHPISMDTRPVRLLDGQPEPDITAIHCDPSGKFVFCGKRDGTVSYFETVPAKHREALYCHASDISITCILYVQGKQLLITADESGRLLINKVTASESGFEFCCLVGEIRSENSLSMLLHDALGTKILLRGKRSTQIWTIDGQNLELNLSDDCDDNGEAVLVNHPLHPGHFVSIGDQRTNILAWEDGQRSALGLDDKNEVIVTPPTPTLRQGGDTQTKQLQYEETWSSPFFVKLHKHDIREPPKYSGATDTIQIWPASSVTVSNHLPSPIPLEDFSSQAHLIRQIIGISGNVLYFLDTDLWICSLDITDRRTISAGAKRHCFLLSEWRNAEGKVLIEYVPTTNEFVISKKHELLVISGALEFEEPWG